MRLPTPAGPAATGTEDGLAYTLWLPDSEPWGRLVILHGAGSCKESHHDFARAGRAAGLAVACFDQRGHGESEGALDDRAVLDVGTIAAVVQKGAGPFWTEGAVVQEGAGPFWTELDTKGSDPKATAPLFLRGSSMGGYLALVAAEHLAADAVVAICPASNEMLLRGLRTESFDFRADRASLEPFLAANRLDEVLSRYPNPVLLLHAEGDERVPVEHSRELETHLQHAQSRLIAVPGGHHRSVQHDGELQGLALRWLRRLLGSMA